MASAHPDMAQMIATLRPLLGADSGQDFVYPSMLKDVPSLTLPYTDDQRAMRNYAELGGSSFRNRG